MIELPKNGLAKSPEMLMRLDSLAQRADDYKLTKRTTTVLNILKDLNQTLHDGDASYYTIPHNPDEVAQLLLLYENAGGSEAEYWMDYDYRRLFALLVSHIFAFEVEANIIKLSVKKMMAKPSGFFANRESGNLRKTIIDGAGETHSMLAHQLPDFAMTIVSPIVLLIFFFLFDWRLGLASLIPMVTSILIMATMTTKKNMKMREEYYEGLANLSAEAVEYVRGIPVVKTFAQSVESFARFYSLIVKMKDFVVRWSMGFKNKMSLYEAISSSTAFFLVPVAIMMITSGGDVRQILGNSVIYLLIGPVFGIFMYRSATIQNFTYFAELALDKIDAALDYDDFTYGEKTMIGEGLEFRNVSFAYGKEKVLDKVSFKVNKGETVALVGASGGGKTTVARLAARFYDADEGEILVGGANIKEYEKSALMRKIAFVFQKSELFKMSLRENLLLGNPNAGNEEIEQALVRAGAKEIVDNREKGLDTVYGTKGTYFSGGEAISNRPAKFLLLFFLLLPIHVAWGQEQGDSPWQLKGFVDTYHAVRSEKPNDFMSSRTRVRGEIGKSFGSSTLFVSFNATHNALLKERTGFELREAYLDHREEHWGFRLGRQLVIWGVADGVPELMGDNPYTARNSMAVMIDLKARSIGKIDGIPYTDGHSVAIEYRNGEILFAAYGVDAAGVFAYSPATGKVRKAVSSAGNIAFMHFFE